MEKKKYQNKDWLEKQYEILCYTSEISKTYGINYDTLEYWRKKFNIEKKKKNNANKKYSFDENFFETIDTEEKAYWLGFIMADGCITSNIKNGPPNRLEINLKDSDESHLKKFITSIKGTQKVLIRKIHDKRGFYTQRATVRINSVKISRDLIKLGVVQNKTGKEFIPNIDDRLLWHFVRGFFDGDGSITKTKNTTFKICSSSEKIINQLSQFFKKNNIHIGIQKYTNYTNPFFIIETNKKKSIKQIFEKMYSQSKIYLERKYEKFLSIGPDL